MPVKLSCLIFFYILLTGSARSANIDVPMPQVQNANTISYISGGIGLDERAVMRNAGGDYNLRLQFAVRDTGRFLASTPVTIIDAKGNRADIVSEGPWILAKLPPGPCKVIVKEGTQMQTRTARITAKGHSRIDFYLTE